MDKQKILLAVESVCNTGCTSVNAVIQALESGYTIKEFKNFNQKEINSIKLELKSIMSVYEHKHKN